MLRRHVFRSADHHSGAGNPLGFEGAGDAKIHDPGIPLFIDHNVLGFEVAVDDAQPVSFSQSFTDLLGDVNRSSCGQLSGSADEAFQILPGDVFHGDVVSSLLFSEVEHAADVAVGDHPGGLQLVAEAFDRFFIRSDLGLDELEGDFLLDLLILDPVDLTHSALSQLLDDLVTPGKSRSAGQFFCGSFQSLGGRSRAFFRGRKLCAAFAAETAVSRVVGMAFGTFHG